MHSVALGGGLLLAPLSAVEDAKVMMRRLGHADSLPLKFDGRPIGIAAVAVDETEARVALRRRKAMNTVFVIFECFDGCLTGDDGTNLWRDREVHLFR